jgi:hypothetical protein
MFVDAQGHFGDLDLLDDAWRRVGVLQGPAAVGAILERVVMGIVDLFRSERRAVVRRMTTALRVFPSRNLLP